MCASIFSRPHSERPRSRVSLRPVPNLLSSESRPIISLKHVQPEFHVGGQQRVHQSVHDTPMTRKPSVIKNVAAEWRQPLEKRYGNQASKIQFAEAFEITEYGHQLSEQEIRRLFPFFHAMALDH
jgi:hypothetical protein